MKNKIIDLFLFFCVSFMATIMNLSMINGSYWLLNNNLIHFENWHCLIAYGLTSIITFKILFTNNNK